MNFIIKIINNIIITINRLLDGLNKKTVDIIRNSFFGFAFILIIIGVAIGYNKGKGSARIFGKPLNESTNNVFDATFKRDRYKGQYRSMVETELFERQNEMQLEKVDFPSNETMNPEFKNKVMEPEPDIKKNTGSYIDNPETAEVERTGDIFIKPEVTELKKEIPGIREKSKTGNPIDRNLKIIEK